MVINETRNSLVTDILVNIRKSTEWIGGVVKWAYFQKKKKWSIPLRCSRLHARIKDHVS